MALNKRQAEFLSIIVPIVQRQVQQHHNKLYPSVTIAQAIHESGWGTSKRMVAANALFGVKVGNSAYHFGDAWHGAVYKTGTTEYYDGKTATKITDWFRQYSSIEDSVCDYMDMLIHCKRYRGAVSQPTPKKSIEGIIAGGYATGPNYVNAITKIINSYNLTQYDMKVLGCQVISEVCPYAETEATLRRGMRGDKVKYLQWMLNNHGASLNIDGSFGPATFNAVQMYQKKVFPTEPKEWDGIVGKKTWSILKKL